MSGPGSQMVWLSWNSVISTGMLWPLTLGVSYAEAKADVVALVRGQDWSGAVANGTAVQSARSWPICLTMWKSTSGGVLSPLTPGRLATSDLQTPFRTFQSCLTTVDTVSGYWFAASSHTIVALETNLCTQECPGCPPLSPSPHPCPYTLVRQFHPRRQVFKEEDYRFLATSWVMIRTKGGRYRTLYRYVLKIEDSWPLLGIMHFFPLPNSTSEWPGWDTLHMAAWVKEDIKDWSLTLVKFYKSALVPLSSDLYK